MKLRYIDLGHTQRKGKADRLNTLSLWADLSTPVLVRAIVSSDSVHIVSPNGKPRSYFLREDALDGVLVNEIPSMPGMRESLFVSGTGGLFFALAFEKCSLFNALSEGNHVRHAFYMAISAILPDVNISTNANECSIHAPNGRFVGYNFRPFCHVAAISRPGDVTLFDRVVSDEYRTAKFGASVKASDFMTTLDDVIGNTMTIDEFSNRLAANWAAQLGLDGVVASKPTKVETARAQAIIDGGVDWKVAPASYLAYSQADLRE
jgi:hypothetical protein